MLPNFLHNIYIYKSNDKIVNSRFQDTRPFIPTISDHGHFPSDIRRIRWDSNCPVSQSSGVAFNLNYIVKIHHYRNFHIFYLSFVYKLLILSVSSSSSSYFHPGTQVSQNLPPTLSCLFADI